MRILSATGRVDALHGGTVGLYQVLVFAAKTYPTERPVAVIEEFRPHNVFHVAGEDETVLVAAVTRYFGNAGIINGFHERVAVIEEVRAPADKLFLARKWRFNVASTLRRNSAGFSCSIRLRAFPLGMS